jgi:hypothetical protein
MTTNNRFNKVAIVAAFAALASAGSLEAQVAWETPMLAAPRPPAGFGVYLADVAGGGLGVLGTYRGSSSANGLEFRFGIAEGGPGDDINGLFGVSLSGLLARESGDMPFDISWIAGAGVGFGDWALITIPVGVSFGHTFRGDGINITPYVTPRLHLDAAVGDDIDNGDDTDLGLSVDLGFDLAMARGWVLRFGAGLGDHEGFALGIVF